METALAYLRERNGSVLFMAEKGEDAYYRGKKTVDFVAEANAQALAEQIEKDWYSAYQAAAQGAYSADAFLPEDLYVFDGSMEWCIVFTHELTDCDSADSTESRACILCTR